MLADSVIGGLVTGIIALAAVWMTNRNAERREGQNRKNEAVRIQREERKQTYIQFIKYVVKTDIGNRYQSVEPPIDREKYVDEYACSISALVLLSPEISDRIIDLHKKYKLEDEAKFLDEWEKLSDELKTEVFPLMQAEMRSVS
jgi:hypothetical protein